MTITTFDVSPDSLECQETPTGVKLAGVPITLAGRDEAKVSSFDLSDQTKNQLETLLLSLQFLLDIILDDETRRPATWVAKHLEQQQAIVSYLKLAAASLDSIEGLLTELTEPNDDSARPAFRRKGKRARKIQFTSGGGK